MKGSTEMKKLYLLAACTLAGSAHAQMSINITRLSDTTAIVSGAGTLNGPVPLNSDRLFVLDDPFTFRPGENYSGIADTSSSNFMAGTTAIDSSAVAGAVGFNLLQNGHATFYVYSGVDVPLAASNVTGQMLVSLLGGATWAPVGTSGALFWGTNPGATPQGTWTVSSVPEVQSLLLFSVGLAGIFAVRRGATAA